MSFKMHIIFMLFATVASWISWSLVLLNVNPFETGAGGLTLFYITLFLSLFGTLVLLGFAVRSIVRFRRMTSQYKISTAMRQGFLWAFAFVLVLSLQGFRLLTWWVLVFLIIVFILVEYLAVALKQDRESE